MSLLPTHTVGTADQFLKWAKTACQGEFVIYHAGALTLDRTKDSVLDLLADTVRILQETAFVTASQKRFYLNITDVFGYIATRTGRGYAPSGLIERKITSHEWRAMRAIRDRDPDISATRAIRDAVSSSLSSSDEAASSLLESLRDKNLITEAKGKGWELTKAGLRVMT